MSIGDVLNQLERVRSCGPGSWTARCPLPQNHNNGDKRPSLSIKQDGDTVLVHCFGGCPQMDLVDKLGLQRLRDDKEPEAIYPYHDEYGTLLYEVLRFPGKKFLRRQPGPNGEWIWHTKGIPNLIYRLPKVVEAVATGQSIWIVEGERDVHTLEDLGEVATTSGSAGSWRAAFSKWFDGAKVVVIADNDPAGRKHARTVQRLLAPVAAGGECSVVVAPSAKDITDHLRAGGTLQDLVPLDQDSDIPAVASPVPHRPEPSRPTLDEAALHGPIGEFITELAPQVEADPVALLMSTLVATGCMLGGGPHAVASATKHSPRLFVSLVGSSSTGRKGSSWAPIVHLLERIDSQFVENRIFGGFGSGEALVDAARSGDPRMLIFEPELYSVLERAAREKTTLSSVLREAWDGTRLQVRSRSGTTVARDTHVSLLSHITPADLATLRPQNLLNGFANRFLFPLVHRAQLLPDAPDLLPSLARWARWLQPAIDEGRRPHQYRRTEDANALWADWYMAEAERADAEADVIGTLLARGPAQALRLSVLFAAIDNASDIEKVHVEAALAIWRYCADSASMLFGAGGILEEQRRTPSPLELDLDKLFGAIALVPEGLDRTQMLSVFGGRRTISEVARLAGELERRKMVVVRRSRDGHELWKAV